MSRFTRLARQAWRLRHDREALLRGLDRAGVRIVPGASRHENRSPRVGRLVDDAWAGHVRRAIAELENLAAGDGREAVDATIALADWDVVHHDPARAVERLRSIRRLPRDGRVILDEARRLVEPPSHESLRIVNDRLTRSGFVPVSSTTGLLSGLTAVTPRSERGPLVTVIVPVFEAHDTIASTLSSLLAQTWESLQIVVIDDASSDGSSRIVHSFDDPRVESIRHVENVGAYAARNRGLAVARGDFVTVNDADDWAHPEKIETQVRHLVSNPGVVANSTALARLTDDLRLVRRGIPHGRFVGHNHASLMMRSTALRDLGGWDVVRFGADSELESRLQAIHGPKAIARLHESAPLTLARQDVRSLTGSPSTGLGSSRASTGARHLYTQSYTAWHRTLSASTARLERVDDVRPFPCPSLVRRRPAGSDHVDVVVISDLGLPGGTTASNLAEIAANSRAGWSTALVHNANPRYRDLGVNPKYFDACSDRTRLLCAGEVVSCDVLIVKYPPSAIRIPDVFPSIEVRHEIVVAANQTPWTGYTGVREEVYAIETVDREIVERFGKRPIWFPIGPAIRDVFVRHHRRELDVVRWSDDDWYEVIDAASWRRPSRPEPRPEFHVGRHGRDSEWKWPVDPDVFAAAYPSDPGFVVDILGGAEAAKQRLGRLPSNWRVLPFDSLRPADYLAELDVFVHVAHPDMEEAFGRTILEALAAGVPVVTEPRFAAAFGDAVIACEPHDVRAHLDRLRHDPLFYDEMVRRGFALVESRFGFTAHQRRIDALRH